MAAGLIEQAELLAARRRCRWRRRAGRRHDERPCLLQLDAKPPQVVIVNPVVPGDPEDARDGPPSKGGDSKQELARGAVDVDRERFGVTHRPRQLRIGTQIESGAAAVVSSSTLKP